MFSSTSSSLLRSLRSGPVSASRSSFFLSSPASSSSTSSRILPQSQFRSYSTPTPTLDSGEQIIYEKLKSSFPGKQLEVQDVSGGCGSFYAIVISSPAFKGLSTIKQHKLVNKCLKDDIKTIHGLQLKTIPEE